MDEDRAAILLNAQALALKNIDRYPTDLHAFRIYGNVAVALASVGGGTAALDDAIERARIATPGTRGKVGPPGLDRT
jgi:hypothetical protein